MSLYIVVFLVKTFFVSKSVFFLQSSLDKETAIRAFYLGSWSIKGHLKKWGSAVRILRKIDFDFLDFGVTHISENRVFTCLMLPQQGKSILARTKRFKTVNIYIKTCFCTKKFSLPILWFFKEHKLVFLDT